MEDKKETILEKALTLEESLGIQKKLNDQIEKQLYVLGKITHPRKKEKVRHQKTKKRK